MDFKSETDDFEGGIVSFAKVSTFLKSVLIDDDEKNQIVERYLKHYDISYTPELIELIARKVDTVPRKIHNLIVKIRDFLISNHHHLILDEKNRPDCESRLSIRDGGITNIHEQYLNILKANTGAV